MTGTPLTGTVDKGRNLVLARFSRRHPRLLCPAFELGIEAWLVTVWAVAAVCRSFMEVPVEQGGSPS